MSETPGKLVRVSKVDPVLRRVNNRPSVLGWNRRAIDQASGRRDRYFSPIHQRLIISRNTVNRGLVPTTYEAFFSAGFASFFPLAGSPIVVSFTSTRRLGPSALPSVRS